MVIVVVLLWSPSIPEISPKFKSMTTMATKEYSYGKGLGRDIVIASMRGRGLQEILDGTSRVLYLRYVHIFPGLPGSAL